MGCDPAPAWPWQPTQPCAASGACAQLGADPAMSSAAQVAVRVPCLNVLSLFSVGHVPAFGVTEFFAPERAE